MACKLVHGKWAQSEYESHLEWLILFEDIEDERLIKETPIVPISSCMIIFLEKT
jgi:hypothetical protein